MRVSISVMTKARRVTANLPEPLLDHWVRVGDLRRELLSKGVSVSTPDAHVAQCALDRAAILLSHDEVFVRIARFSRLELRRAAFGR